MIDIIIFTINKHSHRNLHPQQTNSTPSKKKHPNKTNKNHVSNEIYPQKTTKNTTACCNLGSYDMAPPVFFPLIFYCSHRNGTEYQDLGVFPMSLGRTHVELPRPSDTHLTFCHLRFQGWKNGEDEQRFGTTNHGLPYDYPLVFTNIAMEKHHF